MAEFTLDRLTFSIAAQIIAKDSIRPGKIHELVVPLAAIGHSGMDHHERRSLASNLIVYFCAVNMGKTGLNGGCQHVSPSGLHLNTNKSFVRPGA
jgi:hypothetical protein